MPAVYFASDVVIQTSDNEGTPVALIEAQAAGVPVVSTRVGGTESAVADALLQRGGLRGSGPGPPGAAGAFGGLSHTPRLA